jgi:hypothetical protein
MKFILSLFAFTVLSGSCICYSQQIFKHDIKSKQTPWSYEPKTNTANQFAFAIISDLNSGERQGVFEVAAEQINLLKPQFVLSIGDLIEGGTRRYSRT